MEVIKKVSRVRTTHNGDGRYTLTWRVLADGTIERNSSRHGFRPIRPGDNPPPEIVEAAESARATVATP